MKPHVKICTTTLVLFLLCGEVCPDCQCDASLKHYSPCRIVQSRQGIGQDSDSFTLFHSIYFNMRKLRLLKILLITLERKK